MRKALIFLVITFASLGLTAEAAIAKDQNTPAGAEKSFSRYISFVNHRQWGPLYRYIHPAQKAQLDKATFIACLDRTTPADISISDLEFTDHGEDPAAEVPGTDVEAKATSLTVEYTMKQGSKEQKQTDTVHVFYVNGKWLYVLSPALFDACTSSTST